MNKKAKIAWTGVILIFFGVIILLGGIVNLINSINFDYELDSSCEKINSVNIGQGNNILKCFNEGTGEIREFYYDCDLGFYKVDCEYIELNEYGGR